MKIDILLPYDHFEVANLDVICHALAQQTHTDFNLKILIDPVQKDDAMAILAKYPQIKSELHEYKIFDVIDLDYTALYHNQSALLNLYFNPDKLIYQQFLPVISYGEMVQELAKHSQSDYLTIIDPYTILMPKHLANATAIQTNDTDLIISRGIVQGYFHLDLKQTVLNLDNQTWNMIKTDSNPNNIIPTDNKYFIHNQYNNLATFGIKSLVLQKFINDYQISELSKFGLYWQFVISAINLNIIETKQTSVCVNIDKNIDYYLYHTNDISHAEQLNQIMNNQLNAIPFDEGDFKTSNFVPINEQQQFEPAELTSVQNPARNPLVTIGVPCYNQGFDVIQTLDSLCQQTYANLEIICVNDKSTDNTLDVLNQYAQKDPRIKVIDHEKNLGLSGSRNTIIENATGQYIQFTDSGDLLRSDTISSCLNIFDQHSEIEFVKFKILIRNVSTDKLIFNRLAPYPHKLINNDQSGIYTANEYPNLLEYTSACLQLYKTSFLKDNNIKFKLNLKCEDVLFTMNVHSFEPKFYFSNQAFYYYIMQENSIMTSGFSQKDFSVIDLWNNDDNLFKNNITLQNQARALHLQTIWLIFTNIFKSNIQQFNADNITTATNLLQEVRNKAIANHNNNLHGIIQHWLNSPTLPFHTFIILTCYATILSDHDYQQFMQYLLQQLSDSDNLFEFHQNLNPKFFFNKQHNTKKTKQRLLKFMFKNITKLSKLLNKQIPNKSRFKYAKRRFINKYKIAIHKYIITLLIKQILQHK